MGTITKSTSPVDHQPPQRATLPHAEAEAIGSRRMLWQILGSLSRLETDPTEAKRLRQQAGEIAKYIADHISDPELQASFLGLPEVRAVLTK